MAAATGTLIVEGAPAAWPVIVAAGTAIAAAAVGVGTWLANQVHNMAQSTSSSTTTTSQQCTQNYQKKKNNLNNIKKNDVRPQSTVGDGSTAGALREEIKTGQPTKGKWHYKKALELAAAYLKRVKDAEKEEKNGDITKQEADDLVNDGTEGYVRNDDAVKEADKVPNPPWPK